MGVHIHASHGPFGQANDLPTVPQWTTNFAELHFRRVTAQFDGARGMDILTFQQRVVDAYQSVFEELEASEPSHPVRFWAFIPGIHDDLGAGLDRYMAFNAGRYGAFALHFGRSALLGRSVPTASAVGVGGDRFVLHALAASEPGVPVENPRQVSAYHYSRRFGPMPPCFARATLLTTDSDEPLLIVGGTASIVGEESRHLGDLPAQTRETFRNLGSVIASSVGHSLAEGAADADVATLLADFHDLRVYYTREDDRAAIAASVRATFQPSCRVELLPASLCRPELLIEIEGLATPRRRQEHRTFGSIHQP
jgi:chorismate lyase / 3-hydroxybenzoate synthase